tara:strand:+ start:202 stop:789 length:588 start_codon:yes stop_codon:yes gene_type:complete
MGQDWERREGETVKAYEAFCIYRDLGSGRSLLKAWRQQDGNEAATKTPGKITKWSSQWSWSSRAEAWDRHRAKVKKEEEEAARKAEQRAIIDERIDAKRERIRAAQKLMQKGLDLLDELDPEQAAWRDVVNMIRVAQEQLRKDFETEQSEEEQEDAIRDLVDKRIAELAGSSPKALADGYRDVLAAVQRSAAKES